MQLWERFPAKDESPYAWGAEVQDELQKIVLDDEDFERSWTRDDYVRWIGERYDFCFGMAGFFDREARSKEYSRTALYFSLGFSELVNELNNVMFLFDEADHPFQDQEWIRMEYHAIALRDLVHSIYCEFDSPA